MRTFVVVVALAVLGGCAGLTREQRIANSLAVSKLPEGTVLTDAQVSALDQDKTYVCETRAKTGSHIPHRVCRTLRHAEKEASDAQLALDKMNQQPLTAYDASGVTAVSAQGGGGGD